MKQQVSDWQVIGDSRGLKVIVYKGNHRANSGVGKVENEHQACVFPGLVSSHHFKFRQQVQQKLNIRRDQIFKNKHLDRGGGAQDDLFLKYLKKNNDRINIADPKLECYNASAAHKPLLWANAPNICPQKVAEAQEYTSKEKRERANCEAEKLGNYTWSPVSESDQYRKVTFRYIDHHQ